MQENWREELFALTVNIVERLTELKAGQESIVDHLRRLNGKVAEHEAWRHQVAKELAEHPLVCPMREMLGAVRDDIAEMRADLAVRAQVLADAKSRRARLDRWLLPVALAFGGAIVAMMWKLMLIHSHDLLK